MKLVLFDCDGTLVDSAGLIHEVMRHTFIAFGKPEPALETTKSIIGLTLDIAIARMDGKLAAVHRSTAPGLTRHRSRKTHFDCSGGTRTPCATPARRKAWRAFSANARKYASRWRVLSFTGSALFFTPVMAGAS